ncbi:Septin-10, partial [Varanus komodoensis]
MVQILQLVQNRAARLLMGTGRCSHITPVLRQLHWLPIEVWAQFKVLVMTYKALNGLGPGYLKEHLRPYMSSHPLRSATDALLREPSVNDIRRVSTRETGIGKSTLIDSLFNTSFDDRVSTHFQPNVRLKAETYELQESNVRLKLTIVNTVGFGDQINKDD